jgi:hypothetical protein
MSFQYSQLGPSGVPALSGTQRRATVRYRCPLATLGRVFIAASYKNLTAWVLDLSVDGAGLQLACAPEVGTWVSIELDSSTSDLTLELAARVAHATPRPDGTWTVGCAFDNRLSEEELEAML